MQLSFLFWFLLKCFAHVLLRCLSPTALTLDWDGSGFDLKLSGKVCSQSRKALTCARAAFLKAVLGYKTSYSYFLNIWDIPKICWESLGNVSFLSINSYDIPTWWQGHSTPGQFRNSLGPRRFDRRDFRGWSPSCRVGGHFEKANWKKNQARNRSTKNNKNFEEIMNRQ